MSPARILVVDNESIIARNIENRLKKAGYETLGIALSGVEAIERSCELLPDLILMDIVMDDEFDGIEATARIHDFLEVPVIYLTAHDDDEHLQRAMQTEPYGYLIKPIETNELRSAIEVALRKSAIEQKQKRQLQQLTAIRMMDQAVLSHSSLAPVLVTCLQQMVSCLGLDAARLLLVDAAGGFGETDTSLGFREQSEKAFSDRPGPLLLPGEKLVFIPSLGAATELTLPVWVAAEGFTSYLSVLLTSAGMRQGVLELFQRTELSPEKDWLVMLEALVGRLELALEHFGLLEKLRDNNESLVQAYDATIQGWSHALELRDHETQGHSQRVTKLTLQLAAAMHYPETKLIHVRRGALLHDIGKMGVPDGSLLKTGPLSPAEWEIMRQHPQYAYDLLKDIPFLAEALEIPYCHHERWDGTGYPRGLKGEEIPLASRIFTIVDVWDALSTDRCYREAWPMEKIVNYIAGEAGAYFDPLVVEAFLKLISTETLNPRNA